LHTNKPSAPVLQPLSQDSGTTLNHDGEVALLKEQLRLAREELTAVKNGPIGAWNVGRDDQTFEQSDGWEVKQKTASHGGSKDLDEVSSGDVSQDSIHKLKSTYTKVKLTYGTKSSEFRRICLLLGKGYNKVAKEFMDNGDLKAAYDMLLKAEAYAGNSLAASETMKNFAQLYRLQGNIQQSVESLQHAANFQRKHKQLDDLADTQSDLCATLSHLGMHKEALQHGRQALSQIRRKVEFDLLAGIETDVEKLAVCYFNVGTEEEHLKINDGKVALRTFRDGLKLSKRHLGEQHKLTLLLKRAYSNNAQMSPIKSLRGLDLSLSATRRHSMKITKTQSPNSADAKRMAILAARKHARNSKGSLHRSKQIAVSHSVDSGQAKLAAREAVMRAKAKADSQGAFFHRSDETTVCISPIKSQMPSSAKVKSSPSPLAE
jgi:tetratricopeptide (TPR) repeat protein